MKLLDSPPAIVAFERRLDQDLVRVAVNLSSTEQAWQGHKLRPWGWQLS